MIAKLKGLIEAVTGSTAIVDVGGVGYEVHCTRACLGRITEGERAELTIYTEVKEDLIRLYGFADELEKQAFLLLMQVKGIGPRSAADLLSKVDKQDLMRFIGQGDISSLNAVKGIGKKTAERIIVELKDRIGEYVVERHAAISSDDELSAADPGKEALAALLALGFTRKDAERAIYQVQVAPGFDKLGSGEIVKEALRHV